MLHKWLEKKSLTINKYDSNEGVRLVTRELPRNVMLNLEIDVNNLLCSNYSMLFRKRRF